jgi:hypothetical protein
LALQRELRQCEVFAGFNDLWLLVATTLPSPPKTAWGGRGINFSSPKAL